MIEPKAIFLDMDGTLLASDNRVSQTTKLIIDQIREKGIYVFIATGRAKREIFTTAPTGFEVDGVISSNGMTGYLGTKKLFEHTLPFPLVEKVVQLARENQVYYELFPTEGLPRVEQVDQTMLLKEVEDPKPDVVGISEWIERKEAIETGINWVDQIEPDKYSKFYCFSRNHEKIELWQRILEELNQTIPFSMSSSTLHNIEIMVANKNKATGIQHFLEHLNLTPDQILAMGDSYNDESMFKLAGHTVAMKNAPIEVQAMTDEVTSYTNDEEGVYHYLNKLFFEKS
ncbi:Cof-type HAD-IIB family hydrolase [Amphibacillus sp. Q70]|uniref:Cof-type HAD-IIB family hydrolase n=1 Tax=Amphibacillus sp. Q70 TaxID=3453416 RepID=UPI003F85DD3E